MIIQATIPSDDERLGRLVDFWHQIIWKLIFPISHSGSPFYFLVYPVLDSVRELFFIKISCPFEIIENEDVDGITCFQIKNHDTYSDPYYQIRESLKYLTGVDSWTMIAMWKKFQLQLHNSFGIDIFKHMVWAAGW
jgi:hypothetical protein